MQDHKFITVQLDIYNIKSATGYTHNDQLAVTLYGPGITLKLDKEVVKQLSEAGVQISIAEPTPPPPTALPTWSQ